MIQERPEHLDNLASQVSQDSQEPPGYVVPVEFAEHKALAEQAAIAAQRVEEARLAQLERKEHRAFQDQRVQMVLRDRRAFQAPPVRRVRSGQR